MPETLHPAKRWNSFVCPGCRFVFRVSQDHDGKGVVCPACRIMLRLPASDDETPPLLTSTSGGDSEDFEEIEAGGDDDPVHDTGSGNLKFFLGLSVPALVLLALFAWWMAPERAKPAPAVPLPADLAVNAIEPAVPPATTKSLGLEIETVVKSFLTAPTAEESLRHVRNPEKTAPKLNAWLGGKTYTAPGFREVVGDSVSNNDTTGKVFAVNVRTGDFELREIVVVGTEGNLKVDWESWAGWSEMPWEEFQAKRPVDGKWFRVELSPIQYYNFDFKDEGKWVSYRLNSPDGTGSCYGYVPRITPREEKIRPVDEKSKVKLLLKLKFPPGAASKNQVIIEAVSGQGWVELPESESP